jgi:hypothetical protein
MLGLTPQTALGDEQREVDVLGTGRLDAQAISAWMRSQMAYPYGRITIVPRIGPVSASVAFASTS